MLRALALLSAFLLFLDLYGMAYPVDLRKEFGVDESYASALQRLDASFAAKGPGVAFLADAAAIYSEAIDFSWPTERTWVAAKDNWLIYLLGHIDPVLVRSGLTNVDNLFSEFQSLKYERGFRRGFGICSQNALAMADLLKRRYDIDSHIVSLGGHVIIEAVLEHSRTLHDPSVGVSLPFGFDELDGSTVESVAAAYAHTDFPELAATFDDQANYRHPAGVSGYRPKLFVIERVLDWLSWLLPLAILLFAAAVAWRGGDNGGYRRVGNPVRTRRSSSFGPAGS